jgi:hypothetical protein
MHILLATLSRHAGTGVIYKRKAVFHRPHPQKETDKGALISLRKFLENAGVKVKEKKKP